MESGAQLILKPSEGGLLAKPRTFGATSDDWPAPLPGEPCEPSFATGACGCKAWKYRVGCNRLSCRSCADNLRTRRKLEILRRFEGPDGRQGRDALYTVFTVPPELRAQAADPATWTKWRRAIWKVMKKKFGGLFAVERTDPAGDRAPEKWHPHLNFLWVQVAGARPFINVDALRAEWRGVIGADRDPVFDHSYSRFWGRLNHWYSYMGRTWPDWQGAARRHLSVRWLGKYPKKADLPECCADCGEGFVFVTGLDELAADELAALGPAAVRAEAERRAADKRDRLRDSIGPPLPGNRFDDNHYPGKLCDDTR